MKRYKKNIKKGFIIRISSNKTIMVRTMDLIKHPRYYKTMKKFTTYCVHDGSNIGQLGDEVEIRESRPISKTKCWILEKIISTVQERLYGTGAIST